MATTSAAASAAADVPLRIPPVTPPGSPDDRPSLDAQGLLRQHALTLRCLERMNMPDLTGIAVSFDYDHLCALFATLADQAEAVENALPPH